jgi:class 3 adenylate cyclase
MQLSANPATAEAVERLDMETDIRAVLPAIHVPTLLLYRPEAVGMYPEVGDYLAAQISGAKLVALPGRDHQPAIGDVDAIVDEVEAFLTGGRRRPGLDRILSTVLFTDIVGSTQRLAEAGDARWAHLLAQHDHLARREIERHRGRYIDSTGDGLLATFDGPARAVRCAQALGAAIGELGLDIRGGCHTGEIELVGDRIRGLAVHIGARVGALAHAGEILVSSTVKDLTAAQGCSSKTPASTSSRASPTSGISTGCSADQRRSRRPQQAQVPARSPRTRDARHYSDDVRSGKAFCKITDALRRDGQDGQ